MEQLVDGVLIINNEAIAYLTNSLKFHEGRGEQMMRSVSVGGGQTEQVYSRNLDSNIGKLMFDLPTTPETVEQALTWKGNGNANVCQFSGKTLSDGKTISRTWTGAALVNDYPVEIGSDKNISLEFHSNAAV